MSNDSRILFISDFRYKLGNFSTELPTITSLFPRSCKKIFVSRTRQLPSMGGLKKLLYVHILWALPNVQIYVLERLELEL